MIAHSLTNTWYTRTSFRPVKVQVSRKSSLPALGQPRAASQSSWSQPGLLLGLSDGPTPSSRLLHLLLRYNRMGLSDNSKLLNLTWAACMWKYLIIVGISPGKELDLWKWTAAGEFQTSLQQRADITVKELYNLPCIFMQIDNRKGQICLYCFCFPLGNTFFNSIGSGSNIMLI